MVRKILIIGGVAGGAAAATRLRRLDENADIVLVERGDYVSYANCGLPYYVGGVIKSRNDLFVMTPAEFKKMHNIKVRVNNEAIKIDRTNRMVEIIDRSNGKKYDEPYDYLVLAPGAEQVTYNLPGIDNNAIFNLRTVHDADLIHEYIIQNHPKRVVIVGAGYVGLEMTENLRRRGMNVVLVEGTEQILSPIDIDMAVLVQQHLSDLGVKLYLGNIVKSFNGLDNQCIEVELANGTQIETDIVLLCFGVKPNIKLADEAGLSFAKGIVVNEYLQTDDPYIYAVGDAIEVKNLVTAQQDCIPLAGPANKQGRIVANNICGAKEKYNGTQGTAILKIYDLSVAATGANENALNKTGIKYKKVIIHTTDHAKYYPGAKRLSLKLLFSFEGKILGGQAVGYQGVDKRIDVIASVIRLGGDVKDLKELELSYAPPFSSAKDPVNVLGFIATNILNGDFQTVEASELINYNGDEVQIVDVRELDANELEVIPNSLNIPLKDLRSRFCELDPEKQIVTYCQVGIRSYFATRILTQKGFRRVCNLNGGYFTFSTLMASGVIKNNYKAN